MVVPADDSFKIIELQENVHIFIVISLKFTLLGQTDSVIIGLGYGLVPEWYQAIALTSHYIDHDALFPHQRKMS